MQGFPLDNLTLGGTKYLDRYALLLIRYPGPPSCKNSILSMGSCKDGSIPFRIRDTYSAAEVTEGAMCFHS